MWLTNINQYLRLGKYNDKWNNSYILIPLALLIKTY